MYTRAGGGKERERGGTGRGPNANSHLLDAFGLGDVVAVHAVGRLAGRGVGLRHVRLRELDEVLGVRLGVVVRDVDARLLAGVGVDRGVVEQVLGRVADVGRERVLDALAVLADDRAHEEDRLHALRVRAAVERVGRVLGVAGEVDALAVERRVLAAERAVEALLEDLGHDVAGAAVEEPAAHVLAQGLALVLLARADLRLLHGVRLPEAHVLHAVDAVDAEVRAVQCQEEGVLDALVLVPRLRVARVEAEELALERVLDLVPVRRRVQSRRAAAAPEGLLELGELVRRGHLRVLHLEPALVQRPADRRRVRRRAGRREHEGPEGPAVVALPGDLHDAPDVEHHAGLVGVDVRRAVRALLDVARRRPRHGDHRRRVPQQLAAEARPQVRLEHALDVGFVRRRELDLALPGDEGLLEARGGRVVVGDPVRRLDDGVGRQARRALLPVPARRRGRRPRAAAAAAAAAAPGRG